jgi:hypothetical protein
MNHPLPSSPPRLDEESAQNSLQVIGEEGLDTSIDSEPSSPSRSASSGPTRKRKRSNPRVTSPINRRVIIIGGKRKGKPTRLDAIADCIQHNGWTIVNFIRAWVLQEVETDTRRAGVTRRRQAIAKFVFQEETFHLLFSSLRDKSVIEPLLKYFQPYMHELNQLQNTRPFRTWKADTERDSPPDFTSLNISDDMAFISEVAPHWTTLIRDLVRPPRHSRPSVQSNIEKETERAQSITWMITSMIMHKRAPRSQVFPVTALGLWLHDGGVKDRIMVGLAKLGCCPGTEAVGARLDELEALAKVNSC